MARFHVDRSIDRAHASGAKRLDDPITADSQVGLGATRRLGLRS